ncbi:MAG: DUF1993 domain-containing protein [Oscillatoriales cyanobacterium]|nr:MAG: DUF1993 domain-containing protein [Oscillatoriales cyanobacterium]
MDNSRITEFQAIFQSRLATLSHLLDIADRHFATDRAALFQLRLAPDMLPLGTQIAFTCNQPRNFALWCAKQPASNLNPNVTRLEIARDDVATTQDLLAGIKATDAQLSEIHRVDLQDGICLELHGLAYVDDFLMPNFYFHLTTTYAILRMAGVSIGKRDFMIHLAPFVKQQGDA